MAGRAFAAVRALGELPVVRIGSVAVHALRENQRLLEISAGVATQTINAGMFALQRKLRFGVIEALADRSGRNPLPSAGVVARLATLLRESAVVRIAVTVRALCKRQPGIPRLVVDAGRVTPRTRDGHVHAGQRIPRLTMVKLIHL